MSSSVSILLLAAGSSQRLGRPKQLLPFRGTTLIRHLAAEALASKAREVTVVIGASAEAVRRELSDLGLNIRENNRWGEGLSASIRTGLETLPETAEGVLLMLCDQPLVTSSLLNTMIDHFAAPDGIVACEYADTVGVPVLLSRKLVPELLRLSGDVGAKEVLKAHREEVSLIPFPGGALDIDVPGDLEQLARR